MPKQTLLIVLFLASFKIFAQPYDPTADPIDFIGDIPYNEQETITTALNMGICVSIYASLRQTALVTPCDTLYDIDDTISGCNWTTLPWEYCRAVVNTIPGFPNCKVYAVYKVRKCSYNPLIRQIKLVSYSANYIPDSSLGCDSLANYLDTNDVDEQNIRLRYIEDYLYFSISKREAEKAGDFSLCDPSGNPSSNSLYQQIFYREETCKSVFLVKYQTNTRTKQDYYDVPCISTGCCKTWYTFCKDSLGNVISHINKTPVIDNCVGIAPEIYTDPILQIYNYEPDINNATIDHRTLPCENTCN